MASPERFTAEHAGLLVVDLQGKLLERIDGRDAMLANVLLIVRAAGLLGVPVVATEQYPAGLGPTFPAVADLVPDRFAKTTFHAAATPGVLAFLDARRVRQVTLVGIEAHVCVAQTALELLANGYKVQVLADASSSRHAVDREVAFRRLEAAGAVVSTAEAALFEWAGTADRPEFKALSALVKEADLARLAPRPPA